MSDVITAEERALVDAFPRERVQVIPRGASGETEYLWVPEGKSGGLRPVQPAGWRAQNRGKRGRNYKPSPRVTERRKLVTAGVRRGLAPAEIARETGVPVQTVYSDIGVLTAMGVIPRAEERRKARRAACN